MGWVDETGEHEGWAADITRDGRRASASNGFGVLVRRADADAQVRAAWAAGRPPEPSETYDTYPYADVVAWEAACTCGWTGPRWERDRQTVSEPGADEIAAADSMSVQLKDEPISVEDAARRAWEHTHIAPMQTLQAVRQAAADARAAKKGLDQAVAAARATMPAASWEAIGRAAGVSRQTAHERWSAK